MMKRFVFIFLAGILLAACNMQPRGLEPETPIEAQANAWHLLGNKLNMSSASSAHSPSVAVSSNSNVFAAWSDYPSNDSKGDLYVKRWDGNFWVPLGSALDVNTQWSASRPSLAIDSNENPVVAWYEDTTIGESNIYVKRWNGTAWVQIGTALDVNAFWASYDPSLALDKTNNPVVAWYEMNSDLTSSNLYVKQWNGSSWVQLGSTLNIGATQRAFEPTLALNSSGNPVVAWSEEIGSSDDVNIYVKRWTGNQWVSLGDRLDVHVGTEAWEPSLKLDSSNNPIVAWEEADDASNRRVYVKRWSGTAWVSVGSSLSSKDSYDASLALDATNTPVVTFQEYDGDNSNVTVKKWNGSSWATLANTLDVKSTDRAFSPSLVLDNNGYPVVGWSELDSSNNKTSVYIKRYLTNGWRPLGRALDITLANDANFSSIARKSNDRPVVTWQEFGNIYAKEWTGTSWTRLGGKLNSNAGNHSAITMRSDDKPVIAWSERTDPFSDIYAIRVKYWNGTAWQTQGSITMPSVHSFALAIGSSNNPIIAYSTFGNDGEGINLYVKRWNGSAWVGMNGNSTVTALDIDSALDAGVPTLAVDSTGKPVVSWAEGLGLSSSIYVKRWNGTSWVQLGANLEAAPATHPSLDIDSTGKPVVVWEERVFDGATTQTNISIKRWNGSSWASYGTGQAVDKILGSHAYEPVLHLRSDNAPVVVMTQFVFRDGTTSQDIYMRRWDAGLNQWVDVGVPIDKNIAFNARNPSFVLRSNNNPIVSWDEEDGSSNNVYVSQY